MSRRSRRRHLPRRWALGLPALAVALVAGLVPLGLTPWSGTDDQQRAVAASGPRFEAARASAAERASRSRTDTDLTLPPLPDGLAGLRKAAATARHRLATATAEWQAAKQALEVARLRHRNLARRAGELDEGAAEGRQRLGEIAAQAYKAPDSELAVMLDHDEVDGFLRGASLMRHLERVQGAEVAGLLETQHQARRLAAQSRRLAEQIGRDARALDDRREALAAYADRVQHRLDASLARLEAKRRAANPLAGVPGCAPRPGYEDYPNGLIPSDALCPLPQDGHYLRADAAVAFHKLNDAYRDVFGSDICVTDSYRSLEAQRTLYARKPGLAAVPGTSNHGYGLAVDLCDGAESYGTSVYAWLDANGDRYGWDNPAWARPGGGREEPWHWEYDG